MIAERQESEESIDSSPLFLSFIIQFDILEVCVRDS